MAVHNYWDFKICYSNKLETVSRILSGVMLPSLIRSRRCSKSPTLSGIPSGFNASRSSSRRKLTVSSSASFVGSSRMISRNALDNVEGFIPQRVAAVAWETPAASRFSLNLASVVEIIFSLPLNDMLAEIKKAQPKPRSSDNFLVYIKQGRPLQ